eukprot:COSAG02_NODE_7879_length_2806_cov_2.214629_3_plen_44_part_01
MPTCSFTGGELDILRFYGAVADGAGGSRRHGGPAYAARRARAVP